MLRFLFDLLKAIVIYVAIMSTMIGLVILGANYENLFLGIRKSEVVFIVIVFVLAALLLYTIVLGPIAAIYEEIVRRRK